MKKLLLSSVVLILIFCQISFAQHQAISAKVDSLAQLVLKDWNLPGMAIAISKDNNVFYNKGFGIRNIDTNELVDTNTVFQIGSVTKSFTAALVATLVDEEKFKWDDKIIDLLPDFKMYDTLATRSLQVRDIMTHRTGLRGQAGTYLPCLGYSRNDIYKMLAHIKPNSELRSTYEYNNITFIIAEKLIEKYTGKSWEENLRERILNPLGMANTSANEEGYLASENRSMSAEFEYENGIKNRYLYGDDRALFWLTVIGPAGSINSTSTDLIKWAQLHLNKGKVGETEVLSKKAINYLHRGQIITSMDSARITAYGHCWFIEQTNKYRLYFHTGTTWGFTTLCAFVPEIDLGIAILINSEMNTSPRYAIMRSVIDWFMIGEIREDYHGDYLRKYIERKTKEEEDKKTKEPAEVVEIFVMPPLSGMYRNDVLGDAEISFVNEKWMIKIGAQGWTSELKHVNGKDFSFRMQGHTFPVSIVISDNESKIESIKIDLGGKEDFGEMKRAE